LVTDQDGLIKLKNIDQGIAFFFKTPMTWKSNPFILILLPIGSMVPKSFSASTAPMMVRLAPIEDSKGVKYRPLSN
jgi:hypothetical protein